MEENGDYNRDMAAGMRRGAREESGPPPGFMKQISKLRRWRKYIKYSIVF
jgi:hypothetical protein